VKFYHVHNLTDKMSLFLQHNIFMTLTDYMIGGPNLYIVSQKRDPNIIDCNFKKD